MTRRVFQLLQGVPVVAAPTVQLLPAGEVGDRGALRRLVHPDTRNFPPLVYYLNPTRTFNFDTDVLRSPIISTTRTLNSTVTTRFEEVVEDVIVIERWEPLGGLSIPTFVWREFYNYWVNPPAFSQTDQEYIRWYPRDETTSSYDIEIVDLRVGGGSPGRYGIRKHRSIGGPNDDRAPGPTLTPTDTMDVSPSSILDQPLDLFMRMIREVPA